MRRNERSSGRFRRGRKSVERSASRIDSMMTTVDQLAHETEDIHAEPRPSAPEETLPASPPPALKSPPAVLTHPAKTTQSAAQQAMHNAAQTIVAPQLQVDSPIDSVSINIKRVLNAAEDEAAVLRARVKREHELAAERTSRVMTQAHNDAEAIREHAQRQAKTLLDDVEQIIAEAQVSGQEILAKANAEASGIRREVESIRNAALEEARVILSDARTEGDSIIIEHRHLASARAQEALREYERLRAQVRQLETRRHEVLESLEPLIDQLSQLSPQTAADIRT